MIIEFQENDSLSPLYQNQKLRCILPRQEPDIPESAWIIVILKPEITFLKRTRNLHGIVNQHAVVIDGHGAGGFHRSSSFREGGPLNVNVVGLPLSGWATGVYPRSEAIVKSARLAIGIGVVLPRVQHLEFGQATDHHAAITAALSGTSDLSGCGPLDMKLPGSDG